MRDVAFTHSEYLGGLPDTKKASGNLIFDEDAVGVGMMHPKKGVVAWSDMAGISFDSATMKKSRAGKAVAFGVFALAARKTQNAAEITIQRKDGNVALYSVPGKTGVQVRARVQPFLVARGVPCLDDAPLPTEFAPAPAAGPATAAPTSIADEIAKLVALRDSGVITDQEFTAYKANLLPVASVDVSVQQPAISTDQALRTVIVRIEPDDGSFTADTDTEIIVRGFSVFTEHGERVEHSEEGEVGNGIFYFRIAGATYHPAANELDGDAFSEVLLRHRPDNPHDPNAIEILNQHGMGLVGYVPAKLAPKMLPALMTITANGHTTTGTMGLVAKTFIKEGRVVGGEVLVATEGIQLQVTK